MVMGIHMGTGIRRAAMSICYNSYSSKHKHSSSRMRGRITIIQYWTIHLDRWQKPRAIGSVSADGPRVQRTLSVDYGRRMVRDRRVARVLVRAAMKVGTRARAMTGMVQRPSSFTLSEVSPKRFVFALLVDMESHLSKQDTTRQIISSLSARTHSTRSRSSRSCLGRLSRRP